MNDFGLHFHHLGLAVRESTSAVVFLKGLGYSIGETVFDEIQNVSLILCSSLSGPSVEIICPSPKPGLLDKVVQTHPTGLVYNVCYSSNDLRASLASITSAGLHTTCVSPSKPAILFTGSSVSFYQIAGIGLVEIVESKTREYG